jgi:ion channel-forming bestrophin family protein
MYTGKTFKPILLWHFARNNLFKTLLISTAACLLYDVAGYTFVAIPFVPVATIGTAVAFYIGFKNNQAYDRMWEARRLWGGITNTSRSLTTMFMAVIADRAEQRDFLYRHIAWANVLRLQLRRNIPWATGQYNLHQTFVGEAKELEAFDEGLKQILTANNKMQYYEMLRNKGNTANILLKVQVERLKALKTAGQMDGFEHAELVKQITELFNLQGGCERIKSTPLFRQYSIFSRVFVNIFIFLLPFGLLRDLNSLAHWTAWLAIPFSLLISWIFYTMEQVGEYSENPFDNAVNDVPMSTICRNIEIDIKEMLGETDLPPRLQPHDDVLL